MVVCMRQAEGKGWVQGYDLWKTDVRSRLAGFDHGYCAVVPAVESSPNVQWNRVRMWDGIPGSYGYD